MNSIPAKLDAENLASENMYLYPLSITQKKKTFHYALTTDKQYLYKGKKKRVMVNNITHYQ